MWGLAGVVSDGFAVPVEADAPDGVYYLNVGWYRQVEGQAESLPILDPATGQATAETAVTIGPVKVGGPPAGVTVEQAQPQTVTNTIFGDQIKLLGVEQRMDEWGNGEGISQSLNTAEVTNSLNLTFYWQALRQPDTDYTLFIHVRNVAGGVVAQKDQLLSDGVYPSRLWDEGEIIKDSLQIPLDGVTSGDYQIVVGLYDFITGQRLPVEGGAEGMILLSSIRVAEQQ